MNLTESQLRQIICRELNEVYNKSLSADEITAMTNAVWSTLDSEQLTQEIVKRAVNGYNGAKNSSEAFTHMKKSIGKALEGRQAVELADAMLRAIGDMG